MNKPAAPLKLDAGQREILEKIMRSRKVSHQQVMRARVLLLAADGVANTHIAEQVGVTVVTVRRWRERFAAHGLKDMGVVRSGRGRKPSISEQKVAEIVRATQNDKPPGGRTHWSCRSMAKAQGVSPATVQRIWAARGLKPHLVKTFKLSSDPRFDDKLVDVVGLYLNPPDRAVVLCMDEKSQIQALDRTQFALPMKAGRPGTVTHDYKRNGTTTLFAALDVLSGKVLGQCQPRHRHQEMLKFLRLIDKSVPKDLEIHMILDNYATHKHASVQKWLDAHGRFHLHFTPTSSSWLNLVERWFRDLTDQAIRRGAFANVPALVAMIEAYLADNNENPKPFQWTATAEQILEKVRRGRVALTRQLDTQK